MFHDKSDVQGGAAEKSERGGGAVAQAKSERAVTSDDVDGRSAFGCLVNQDNAAAPEPKPSMSLIANPVPGGLDLRPTERSCVDEAKPESVTADAKPEETNMGVDVVKTDDSEASPETHDEPMEIDHYAPTPVAKPIVDIDDEKNPLLLCEYAKEIYSYLMALEKTYQIRENYMMGYRFITPRMRAILIEWLVQVHFRYKLAPETIFISVNIIDMFLQACDDFVPCFEYVKNNPFQKVEISKDELQLVIYVTDYTYTREVVLNMERRILTTLQFRISRPPAITFLRRFSRSAMASQILHATAKYFLELMLLDYSVVSVHPSMQAAAALRLAMIVSRGEDWTPTLTHYSTYTAADLDQVIIRFLIFYEKHQPGKQVPGQIGSMVAQKYAEPMNKRVSVSPTVDAMLKRMYAHWKKA